MEDVLRMIFSAENVRTAVLLVAAACGFTWLNSKMDKRIDSLREEMNGKFAALREEMNGKFAAQSSEIRELKTNDIAHLYAAIEALVFSMVKNKTLTETTSSILTTGCVVGGLGTGNGDASRGWRPAGASPYFVVTRRCL